MESGVWRGVWECVGGVLCLCWGWEVDSRVCIYISTYLDILSRYVWWLEMYLRRYVYTGRLPLVIPLEQIVCPFIVQAVVGMHTLVSWETLSGEVSFWGLREGV